MEQCSRYCLSSELGPLITGLLRHNKPHKVLPVSIVTAKNRIVQCNRQRAILLTGYGHKDYLLKSALNHISL
ncbi:hypothetical protein VTN00DRAFT_1112 [Thermoascus crustaceus]|uniref:uncharacterized protein n=1 Tax=Thermoascus crustaceus TaxID=5088 RepID=UPI003743C72B